MYNGSYLKLQKKKKKNHFICVNGLDVNISFRNKAGGHPTK